MTRLQAVGVLLIVLGVVYALMYLGWLRRARRHQSAAVAAATGTPVATYRADPTGEIPVVPAPEEDDAPTLMSLEETGQFELPPYHRYYGYGYHHRYYGYRHHQYYRYHGWHHGHGHHGHGRHH